ncbi:MAG: M14 family zinc carboxypeptidase [Bacteroidota bacterium]|nr:M14 family zinc carboxypeptidase [Bacteroidota bacterium]
MAQEGWRKGEMEIKVTLHSATEAQTLKRLGFDAEIAAPEGNIVNVYVTPDELQQIRQDGFDFRISVPDLNAYYKGFWDNPTVPPGYHTYDQMVALADSLAAAFPGICKKVIFGTSVSGRQLAALKICDSVNIKRKIPRILFDGGIHGDEVGGAENLILFARDLCTGYGTDPDLTYLINTREIWIYYMVNPDGRVNMTRYNQNHVDLNRDFGYMWDVGNESPGAFSQPETKALRSCFLTNQYAIYISYHSGTITLSYPWSYRPDPSPDNALLNQLASIYVNSSTYSSLPYGQGYNIMYAIDGSTKDFQYGTAGIPGWTMEISTSKQPPASQIPVYYNHNKPAMVEMIRRAGYGISGIVKDSVSGKPVKARIWINDLYPGLTDPEEGDFHKYLLHGTYSIRVSANGYKSKTITGIQIPDTGSVFTQILLTPDSLRYAYRVLSCQIPGSNFNDPGFTPGCIGAPDNTAYSIGKSGWVVVDMCDTIFNGFGNDLTVYQPASTSEDFICYASVSPDGPWQSLGTGTGTTSFDLASAGLNKARYIKILDNGTSSQNVPGTGFDLDAVKMLTPPLIVDFTASDTAVCPGNSIDFVDKSLGNPIHWAWTFQGGTPGSSTLKNPYNITYHTTGYYNVSLTITNGYSSSALTKNYFIHVRELPVQPAKPTGPVAVFCDSTSYYYTDTIPQAQSYIWTVGPSNAGMVAGNTANASVTWDSAFTGTAYVKVKDLNECGESFYSDSLAVTIESWPMGIRTPEKPAWIKVSPNPVHGTVQVSCSTDDSGIVEVLSLSGKTVFRQPVAFSPGKPEILDLSTLVPGIYFLKFSGKMNLLIVKIIIQ